MPAKRYVSGQAKARRTAYRQSDAGRFARKMYLMQPDVQARMALRRKIKKHLKGGI